MARAPPPFADRGPAGAVAGTGEPRRVVRALASIPRGARRGRPVVLVFEDLHWADDALLDFVDSLAERVAGVALLVVCSARPELLERRRAGAAASGTPPRFPRPADGRGDRTASGRSARHARPAREQQAALLQRAGGNPLFAEEYARLLADGLDPAAGAPRAAGRRRRADRRAAGRREGAPPARVGPRQGLLDGCAVAPLRCGGRAARGAPACARAEGVRAARAPFGRRRLEGSTSSSTRSCATGHTPRCPVPRARTSTGGSPTGSTRCPPTGRTTGPRSWRITCSRRSRTRVSPGSTTRSSLPRAAKAPGSRPTARGRYGGERGLGSYELRELDPAVDDDPTSCSRTGSRSPGDEVRRGGVEASSARPRHWPTRTRGRARQPSREADRLAARRSDGRVRVPRPCLELAEGAPLSPPESSSRSRRWRASGHAGRYAEAGRSSTGRSRWRRARRRRAARRRAQHAWHGALALGDPRWEDDLTRSLELTPRNTSLRASRAYLNLGAGLVESAGTSFAVRQSRVRGSSTRGRSASRERRCAGSSATWPRGVPRRRVGRGARAGRARDRGRAALPAVQRLGRRALIRIVARDCPAQRDATIALREGRAIRDPQALHPALVTAAEVAYRRNDVRAASALLDEVGAPERVPGRGSSRPPCSRTTSGAHPSARRSRSEGAEGPWAGGGPGRRKG